MSLGIEPHAASGQADARTDDQANDQRIYALLDDGGRRWDPFCDWIARVVDAPGIRITIG